MSNSGFSRQQEHNNYGDSRAQKTNQPLGKGLNQRVCECHQQHTFALQISFNEMRNGPHWRSFILINTFKGTPRCWHAPAALGNLKTDNRNHLWVRQRRRGIIMSCQSETLQPLWAREQGEAGMSLHRIHFGEQTQALFPRHGCVHDL